MIMSGMNEYLAQYYGTAGATSAETDMNEDLHKQASYELFAKLAASQNIDINSLSDAQVEELFADFQKQASEGGEEKKDEKKEEAKKELEEKKAAAEKVAEADYLGRVMAHSYIDELQKIAASKAMEHVPGHAGASSKSGGPGGASTRRGSAPSEGMMGMKARHALERGKDKAKDLVGRAGKHLSGAGNSVANFAKAHKGKAGLAAGIAGTAAVAGAAAGAASRAGKEKGASAVDELAAESAVIKAAEAGYDVEEAATKIACVLMLGVTESEKTAGVTDVDHAVDIRSLELLEAAGYPVTWPE
jgi:hypothetical protein